MTIHFYKIQEDIMKTEALELVFECINHQLQEPPQELRRLFHGRGQTVAGLEQITIDWLQGQLLIAVFKLPDVSFIQELELGLMALSQTDTWRKAQGKAILIQHRYQDLAPTQVLWGVADVFPVVTENGLKYQLELGKNQNIGLFLDMRYGRKWVTKNSHNKSVLNLFAYTCGFSVAAIEGGAKHVVNLDMAKSSLSRGRDNHRLNQHDVSKVTFLGHDIFKTWGKLKKLGCYDLIIIDPPSFQKNSFALTQDYQKILRRLPSLLAKNGEVLACVNSPSVSTHFLIEGMANAVPELQFIERIDNPPEFNEIDLEKGLKVMRFAYS